MLASLATSKTSLNKAHDSAVYSSSTKEFPKVKTLLKSSKSVALKANSSSALFKFSKAFSFEMS